MSCDSLIQCSLLVVIILIHMQCDAGSLSKNGLNISIPLQHPIFAKRLANAKPKSPNRTRHVCCASDDRLSVDEKYDLRHRNRSSEAHRPSVVEVGVLG